MWDSLKVARWEIKKMIKSKTFLILTFLIPIIMLIGGGAVGYFSSREGGTQPLNLGLIDKTGTLTRDIKTGFAETNYRLEFLGKKTQDKLEEVVDKNNLDGVLVIPEMVFEKNQIDYYFNDLEGLEKNLVQSIFTSIIGRKRLEYKGYVPEDVYNLIREVDINTISLKEVQGSGNMISMVLLPIGLAMMMVFASVFSGGALMQSIIKEKGNRIVELLFSSITSSSLMTGKIIGFGILGITQVLIWAASGLFVAGFFFDINLTPLLNIKTLYMFIYFIFGFILIASINAIVGAGTKEAQSGTQANGLLIIIPIIPVYFAGAIVNSPGGTISKILSYIPVTAPTTMLLRLGFSTPDLWEIGLTSLILIITNYILIRLSAKIFRVGMLMFGKNASFKELVKWAKQ